MARAARAVAATTHVREADALVDALPRLRIGERPVWDVLGAASGELEQLLPGYLRQQRWFGGKARAIQSVRIGDAVPIPGAAANQRPVGQLAFLDVSYVDGPAERYALGLVAHAGSASRDVDELIAPIARIEAAGSSHVLRDGMGDPDFVRGLFDLMGGRRELAGVHGRFVGTATSALDDATRGGGELVVTPLSLHTSNTSVKLQQGDRSLVLKLVRRHDASFEPGTPTRALDVWKGAYLTDEARYANTPRVLGSIEHAGSDGAARTIGVLGEFVRNDGDSWAHALQEVGDVLRAAAGTGDDAAIAAGVERYGTVARNHGRRLGELHVAFATGGPGSEFRPVVEGAEQAAARGAVLVEDARRIAGRIRGGEAGIADAAQATRLASAVEVRATELVVRRQGAPGEALIHTHGDFHLGQMLRTGDDVAIIDLEGAPMLPIAQRWQRTTALGDVARQRSSYEYAAEQGMRALRDTGASTDELRRAAPVAAAWAARAKDEFLAGWRDAVRGREFVPAARRFDDALTEAEVSNAIYETGYELGSRPDWASIPLARLRQLAGTV